MTKFIPHIAMTVFLCVLLAAPSVRATDVDHYAKNEFKTVDSGRAPNNRFSVAAHGDGEDGNEHFNLYLMSEPSHRRLVRLDSEGKIGGLDTGADAYTAIWSPDSHYVAIRFRSDRHIGEMRLYDIHDGRPHFVVIPSALTAVDKNISDIMAHDDHELTASFKDLVWFGPTKFTLKESGYFRVGTPKLGDALGASAKQTTDENESADGATAPDKKPTTRYIVEYSVEAVGELISQNKVRITNIKPGQFEDQKQ
jgi:hypothetical protein